jgi:hypothetical protein
MNIGRAVREPIAKTHDGDERIHRAARCLKRRQDPVLASAFDQGVQCSLLLRLIARKTLPQRHFESGKRLRLADHEQVVIEIRIEQRAARPFERGANLRRHIICQINCGNRAMVFAEIHRTNAALIAHDKRGKSRVRFKDLISFLERHLARLRGRPSPLPQNPAQARPRWFSAEQFTVKYRERDSPMLRIAYSFGCRPQIEHPLRATAMTKLLYLDQNAWIALARGAWDKAEFAREHAALARLIEAIEAGAMSVPLSFENTYETAKINDPKRRHHMAWVQATISGGQVFRGRRRIFTETLKSYVARRFSLPHPSPTDRWFLSDLWFEAAADYTPDLFGSQISQRVLDYIRTNPAKSLFDFLAFNNEKTRTEAVRRYSAGSNRLVAAIEARRAVVAGEPLAMRKRAYGARLILDELEFILATGRELGLDWNDVGDLGSSLVRNLAVAVPVLNVERELVVRLEDQARAVSENDLRDMSAFTSILPLADVVVAEKPFVNLARQARLGERYSTTLLTSIFDLEL